jgi:assimilatory nitrate reductase catalytic subunit
VGCGVVASTTAIPTKAGASTATVEVSVTGDTEHPSNLGRLCSKGADLAQTFQAPHRLLAPRIAGNEVSWDDATSHIADRFQQTIDKYGSDSIAFYVSGQLLTEDYYVVNKLTKGWLGTANIDTNSRLCMASSVTGHKRAFGSDTVPGCYEDLEQADLLVLVGSNLAWCHPVLYQRIRAAREKRPEMKLVVIDPRRSATADEADLHLALRPDADVLLFNALLVHLADAGQLDKDYLEQHVNGFEKSLQTARDAITPATKRRGDSLSERLGLSHSQLKKFFALVERCTKTVTVYSQGVNQSVVGTDKVNAIINCHLATGRIGKPGMGPFSVTGQPNAMGGREVGGLATMLACHMDLNNAHHRDTVQRFWQSPAIADQVGHTAVELFDAVAKGSIKALWIMATNPIDSMPNADQVERAIASCPFVVVSEVSSATDTMAKAHVALPAQPFGEKNGTVTNSERRISRMRSFTEIQGEARPDWWTISEVAKRMGYADAFSYPTVADIFREYATLSGFENNGTRDFDISAYASITNAEYDALLPFQWPKAAGSNDASNAMSATVVAAEQPVRFFANGKFYTGDRKANMLPVAPQATATPQNVQHLDQTLNTGRIRDQWHTMTRTGYSSRLMSHYAEPFVELHPQLAKQQGIATGDIVKIASSHGHVLLRASVSDRQQPSDVFVPMHWNAQFAARARIDTVVDDRIDPYSFQPAFKNQAVSVTRFPAGSFTYVLSTEAIDMNNCHGIEYWAKAPVRSGWQMELAGSASPKVMLDTVVSRLPLTQAAQNATLRSVEFTDKQGQEHRIAFFIQERLVAMVFVSTTPVALSRSWAAPLLDVTDGTVQSRWQLLAGRPTADMPDKGAIVCSCMMVGEKEIEAAIYKSSCLSVAEVGRCTQAGTQCGSCRNELVQMIKRYESEQRNVEVA